MVVSLFAAISSVRNLDVIFDGRRNLEEHVKAVCKSSRYQIKNVFINFQKLNFLK